MNKKENQVYSRQLKRVHESFLKRPNEILKRRTDDGNLKLTFKSPSYYEKDLLVTKNSLQTNITQIKKSKDILFEELITLDFIDSQIQTLELTNNTVVNNIINIIENVEYRLFIKQNNTTPFNLTFSETIINIKLPENFQIDQNLESVTEIIFRKIDNIIFVKSNIEFRDINYIEIIPFQFTIDTTLGSNAGATFTLPLKQYSYTYDPVNDEYIQNETLNYNFTVDWGDGNTNNITSWDDSNKTHNYDTDGQYVITITGLCEGFGFIDNNSDYNYMSDDYEKVISVQNLSYVGLKECGGMFCDCSNLTTIEQSTNDWCKDVTDLSGMFANCTSLTSLDVSNWDVSNVTNMYGMFAACTSLTSIGDVSNWNVSNITNMSEMFVYCTSLTSLDVSGWDVSNVTNMSYMFNNCTSLTSLDVSNWNVGSITNMQQMFQQCTSLTSLDVSLWNVGSVTGMIGMFDYCTSLTNLDVSNWDVSNVTNMFTMFSNCTSLTSLDVSNWNISNVTDMGTMFSGVTLDTASYDNLLVGWSTLTTGETQIPTDISFDGGLSKYTSVGQAAKNILEGTYDWIIRDRGLQA